MTNYRKGHDVSAYCNDRRVWPLANGGYHVDRDGEQVTVLLSETLGWGCYTGPDLNAIGIGYDTEDAAFRDLIGDPQ